MTDLLADVGGWGETLLLALGAAGTWAVARLEAWRGLTKGKKIITAVGTFLAIVIALSLIQRLFS